MPSDLSPPPTAGSPAHHTPYLIFLLSWLSLSTFLYGFHISALNAPQSALTCAASPSTSHAAPLPSCIPMSSSTFGLVTATFSLGGLFGSLLSSYTLPTLLKRGTLLLGSALGAAGSLLITLAPSVPPLLLGRLLVGVHAGLAITTVPLYLAQLTPPRAGAERKASSLGLLTQISITLGILFAQSLGLFLSRPGYWRIIPLLSALLSAAQGLVGLPKDAVEEGPGDGRRVWGVKVVRDEGGRDGAAAESQALLGEQQQDETVKSQPTAGGLRELLGNRRYRPAVILAAVIMIAQQASGINAVLYYSTSILSSLLPLDNARYVSLFITVINALMTFPPIYILPRLGPKPLLLLSLAGLALSSSLLSISLSSHLTLLSGITILLFVTSFAVGLGPLPFLILPTLLPPSSPIPSSSSPSRHAHADPAPDPALAGALASLALALNWAANLAVGALFFPLRDALRKAPGEGEGRVFWVFAAVCVGTAAFVGVRWRPRN